MDFTPTEAHTDLAALTRQILDDQVTQDRLSKLEAGPDRFDPALWSTLAEAGVLAAALPESVGGSGLGPLERCAVLVEVGRAVAPVPYLWTVAVAGAALAEFGDADVVARWASPVAAGQLLATAALGGGVMATRTATGWSLSGSVTAVPAGPIAELVLVVAATPDGERVFLVTPDDTGVEMSRQRTTDLDSAAMVELAEVELPADRLLGGPAAARVPGRLLDHAGLGLCALSLGIAERALELTAEYAGSREQFGRPIGAFQAVSQRLADAYLDVEAIRLTMWQAAWLLATDQPAAAELATATFWAADGGHRVAHTSVHVHGGVGIDVEHPVHRYFVAAKRAEFALGGATEGLVRLGGLLAGSPER